MQTPTLTRPKPPRRAIKRLRPDDFSRLGLGPTEARVTVIRRAARQLAGPLVLERDPAKAEQAEAELALLVTSVYRLLDPRRRDQLVERVQLLRVDPTPLRSHLLEQVDAFVEPRQSTVDEDVVEQEAEQQAEIAGHDWMLDSLAELRTEPLVRRRGVREFYGSPRCRGQAPIAGKHRTQMLEVARYLQSGNSKISLLTGVLGGVGLLLVGVVLVVALSWFSGAGKTKQVQADPPVPVLESSESRASENRLSKLAPGSAIEFEPSSGKNAPLEDSAENSVVVEADDLMLEQAKVPEKTEAAPSDDGGELAAELSVSGAASTDSGGVGGAGLTEVVEPLNFEFTLPLVPSFDLDAPTLDAPVRHPLPDAKLVEQAKQRIRSLGLADGAKFPIGISSVVELWQQRQAAVAGSAERLALGLIAGQRAVMLGGDAMAMVISQQLSEHFLASPCELGGMFLADAAAEAVTLTEHERVISWGLRISDYGLINEDFVAASDVARLATAAAAKHGDAELRSRLKQRRDSIEIAERMSKTFLEHAEYTPETGDGPFAWNAGRHLCNNRRTWREGLPWLAAGSDVRFASVASEELAITDRTAAADIAAIARRWLDLAERRKGREQGSIRLHARELLFLAAERGDVLVQLELKKESEKLDETLPPDLFPLDLEDAQKLLNGDSSVENLLSQTEAIPPAPTSDPLAVGLIGRLFASGKDTGVVLRYSTSVPLPRSAFDEVLARASLQVGPISVQFHGYIQLKFPTTIRIEATGPSSTPLEANSAEMTVFIGAPQPQAVALQFDGKNYVAKLDLPAGAHRVTWQVSGDQFPSLRLRLSDDRTGLALDLRHDQTARQLVEQPPVRFNVDFRAR